MFKLQCAANSVSGFHDFLKSSPFYPLTVKRPQVVTRFLYENNNESKTAETKEMILQQRRELKLRHHHRCHHHHYLAINVEGGGKHFKDFFPSKFRCFHKT